MLQFIYNFKFNNKSVLYNIHLPLILQRTDAGSCAQMQSPFIDQGEPAFDEIGAADMDEMGAADMEINSSNSDTESQETAMKEHLQIISLCRKVLIGSLPTTVTSASASEPETPRSGWTQSALHALEELLAISMDPSGPREDLLGGDVSCSNVCSMVVEKFAMSCGKESPTAARLALSVLANLSDHHQMTSDLSEMLVSLMDVACCHDAPMLRQVCRLIANEVRRRHASFKRCNNNGASTAADSDSTASWIPKLMTATAIMFNFVLVNTVDTKLLQTAWSCVHAIIDCADPVVCSTFADHWDGPDCTYSCLSSGSYLLLVQKDDMNNDTALKWLLMSVESLSSREKSVPALHSLWCSASAVYPGLDYDLITARIVDLSLDQHWEMNSRLQRPNDHMLRSLSIEDSVLMASMLGKLLCTYLINNFPAGKCSETVNLKIFANVNNVIGKCIRVLDEVLLRLDPTCVKAVTLSLQLLLQLVVLSGSHPTLHDLFKPHDFHQKVFGKKNRALHSIAYLLKSTNILEVLAAAETDQQISVLREVSKFSTLLVSAHDVTSMASSSKSYTTCLDSKSSTTTCGCDGCLVMAFRVVSERLKHYE